MPRNTAHTVEGAEYWLTTKELAQRLGVCVETVRRWVAAGTIPHYRVSRKVIRYRWTEVKKALQVTD